jgi:hypothetical protein
MSRLVWLQQEYLPKLPDDGREQETLQNVHHTNKKGTLHYVGAFITEYRGEILTKK